jgi:hypothetical protein
MFPTKIPEGTYSEIRFFIFKWKFATTRTLLERFFHMMSPIRGYQHLLRLKRWGHIEYCCDPSGTHWAWTLNRRFFKSYQRDTIGALVEVGYRSESFMHDLIVNAIHLGDWLVARPEGSERFSEQQLRRFCPSNYPEWVPQCEIRRPDGLWKVNHAGVDKVVALEVELNQKRKSDYSEIGTFYSIRKEEIHRTLWLVRGPRSAQTIKEALKWNRYDDFSNHLFVTLPDFLKLGWHAPIIEGRQRGWKITELLHGHKVENTSKPPCTMLLLDTRKSPNPTTRCTLDRNFLNRR